MDTNTFIKTIPVSFTDLNDTVFTVQVPELYLERNDECIDLESGLRLIIVDRPKFISDGIYELKVKLLTEIKNLRFTGNKEFDKFYGI